MATSTAKRIKVSGSIDSKFNRTIKGVYQVIADLNDGPLIVLQASGIPAWGSPYTWAGTESDSWIFVNGASPEPKEDINFDLGDGGGTRRMRVWHVTITWSTIASERNSSQPRDNPLDEPPVLSGSFLGGTEPVFVDALGNLIANTAGEPYSPAPLLTENTDSLRLSYNSATLSLSQRSLMMGRVNSVAIWGLPARRVKLIRWDWNVLYAGSLAYISNSFEFHISNKQHPAAVCVGPANAVGWYTSLPNKGYAPLTLPDDENTKKVKKDGEDMPLNAPVSLACDGTETGAETWNVFPLELEADFKDIPGMPDPLPGPFV